MSPKVKWWGWGGGGWGAGWVNRGGERRARGCGCCWDQDGPRRVPMGGGDGEVRVVASDPQLCPMALSPAVGCP